MAERRLQTQRAPTAYKYNMNCSEWNDDGHSFSTMDLIHRYEVLVIISVWNGFFFLRKWYTQHYHKRNIHCIWLKTVSTFLTYHCYLSAFHQTSYSFINTSIHSFIYHFTDAEVWIDENPWISNELFLPSLFISIFFSFCKAPQNI